MTIIISPKNIQNLEAASKLVDSLRDKMANMSDTVLADFDVLTQSVMDIVKEHSYKARLAASNFKIFNQAYEKHRINHYIHSYFCVENYEATGSSHRYDIKNIEHESGFVDNIIINGKKEFVGRDLSTLEIWLLADRRLAAFNDYIVCIDEMNRLPTSRDYKIIHSLH